MVIILVAAVFDCLWLAPIGATNPATVILVNLVVVAVAAVADPARRSTQPLRRQPAGRGRRAPFAAPVPSQS